MLPAPVAEDLQQSEGDITSRDRAAALKKPLGAGHAAQLDFMLLPERRDCQLPANYVACCLQHL